MHGFFIANGQDRNLWPRINDCTRYLLIISVLPFLFLPKFTPFLQLLNEVVIYNISHVEIKM
jgi:hypothetical protein